MSPAARTSPTMGSVARRSSRRLKYGALRRTPRDQVLALDDVEVGERRGAGDRMARVRVAVMEGELGAGVDERAVDALVQDDAAERLVAARHGLGERRSGRA